MNKFTRFLTYLLTALAAVALTLGVLIYRNAFLNPNGKDAKLQRLEQIIDTYFIGEYDEAAIEDAAADAMVNALGDRWSHYISADDYAVYQGQMDNAYVGVGMTVSVREDGAGIDISDVTVGGPAEEAGVRAGDILIRVDGTDVTDENLDEVRNLVLGDEGTQVELTLLREGGEVVCTPTRRTFETPVASGVMLEDHIGLVTIENFNARCADETIGAIEDLLSQGAESLIFDVRNNPGGYKNELVEVLDYLLPEGVLFRSEDYSGNVEEDRSDANCLEIPMVVMVNGESYSAAEFFAAALSEYEAAAVVGQQTCGKGYFQVTMPLGDGSVVGLSIGKYYTPKGVSLAGVGITPDKVVEVDEDTFYAIYTGSLAPEEDPQIQAAVDLLRAG